MPRSELLAAVLALLSALDPYGLRPGADDGAPADEYAIEAGPIAGALLRNGMVDTVLVDTVWLTWFDETLTSAAGSEAVTDLVTQLNDLPIAEEPSQGQAPRR